jgi:hypothetical protein
MFPVSHFQKKICPHAQNVVHFINKKIFKIEFKQIAKLSNLYFQFNKIFI